MSAFFTKVEWRPATLVRSLRHGWQWAFQTLIAPLLRHTASLFIRWAATTADPSAAPDKWKEKAMDDFSAWLAALPDTGPTDEPDPPACDLYTLLTEFATLRQEINMQTRQQRTTLRSQTELAERFGRIGEQLDARIVRLNEIHDALGRQIEEKTATAFFDIRDAWCGAKKRPVAWPSLAVSGDAHPRGSMPWWKAMPWHGGVLIAPWTGWASHRSSPRAGPLMPPACGRWIRAMRPTAIRESSSRKSPADSSARAACCARPKSWSTADK